jgi:predicted aconitase
MRSGRTEKKEKILYGEKGGVVESAMKVIRMMGKNGET